MSEPTAHAAHAPRHGRHSAGTVAVGAWTPRVLNSGTPRHLRPPATAESHLATARPLAFDEPAMFAPPPEPPPLDPFVDTPSLGLGKFNLGAVPASVTPPRSWRHAAWFAVFAAAGVLVTLVYLSVSLVGPPVPADRINALPGFPSQAFPPGDTSSSDRREPSTGQSDGHTITWEYDLPSDVEAESTGDSNTAALGVIDGEGASDHPLPPTLTTAPSYPPPETTVVSGLAPQYSPPASPRQMASNIEEYFREVTTDPAAASTKTGGDLGSEGASGIRRRYGDASSVQVRRIVANPGDRTASCDLTVHHKDGSVSTETHTLRFSDDKNLKITGDSS